MSLEVHVATQKLVVGYSIEALRLADSASAMLLLNETGAPHAYAHPEAHAAWHKLTFILGMRGLLPVPSDIENIRIDKDQAVVTTSGHRQIRISFEELYIFDMEKVEGLLMEEKVSDYIVYDWFNIKHGAKQAACKILTPRNFIKQLAFYPSERKDGNDGTFKDCYAVSYVAADRLGDFEHSETAARLGCTHLLQDRGFRGSSRGVGARTHHLHLVLEHSHRDIYKHKKQFVSHEADASNIFYCNVTL